MSELENVMLNTTIKCISILKTILCTNKMSTRVAYIDCKTSDKSCCVLQQSIKMHRFHWSLNNCKNIDSRHNKNRWQKEVVGMNRWTCAFISSRSPKSIIKYKSLSSLSLCLLFSSLVSYDFQEVRLLMIQCLSIVCYMNFSISRFYYSFHSTQLECKKKAKNCHP